MEPTEVPDWRDQLLDGLVPLGSDTALRGGVGHFGPAAAVTVAWDFSVQGGSFGAADATAFVAAIDSAIERRLPLVTLLRSGGTRLPEGMRALVGIPRIGLALQRLSAAGLPHLSVIDQPTTGGIWVAVGAVADVRIAVRGAVVGFSGPRVVEAMTGTRLAAGANRAESAYAAGLVDSLLAPDEVGTAVRDALIALQPDQPVPTNPPQPDIPPPVDGWEHIALSQQAARPGGAALLAQLLAERVVLRGGDDTAAVAIGRLAGRRVVGVALGSTPASQPTPAGYALLRRAAELAGRLDLGLFVLVDTIGADPHTEATGLAAAIADGMQAVLATTAPTISLVHGAGGSGGALAGAVTDVVGVGPYGWFAALAPDGAAAALRRTPAEAARLMRLTPGDLIADGFADTAVAAGDEAAWLAATFDLLRADPPDTRLQRRRTRWSSSLREPPTVG